MTMDDRSAGAESADLADEVAAELEAMRHLESVEEIESLPPQQPIVGRTWVNPTVPGYVPRRGESRTEIRTTLPDGRPSVVRMLFGSFVVLTEEISERAAVFDDDDAARRLTEAAIRQTGSQQEALDRRPFADLRYGAIGFVGGALDGAQNGLSTLSTITDGAARAAGRLIGPVWNSFLLRPLHRPVQRFEQAGENTVDTWIRRGRVEEVRSRALAEVSLNNLVEESVTDITNNPQVQVLVQEIIASQSTGLAAELVEEIRERLVTLDMAVMGRLRREPAPMPDFRPAYLRALPQRRQQFAHRDLAGSMAGSYAGPVSRLAGFVLDVALLLLVVGLISAFVSSTLNLFGLTDRLNDFLRSGSTIATALLLFVALFNFLVISVYFVGAWHLVGATVGDALVGLRVVSKEGGRVSFVRSLLRLVGYYLSAVVLFMGFLWALFDRRRQGWHDKLGATFVVYDWPARPDERFLVEAPMSGPG